MVKICSTLAKESWEEYPNKLYCYQKKIMMCEEEVQKNHIKIGFIEEQIISLSSIEAFDCF